MIKIVNIDLVDANDKIYDFTRKYVPYDTDVYHIRIPCYFSPSVYYYDTLYCYIYYI